MPQLSSNFILNSKLPNFSRDYFETYDEMIGVDSSCMDEGHISYCRQTDKHYIFRSLKDGDVLEGSSRWELLVPKYLEEPESFVKEHSISTIDNFPDTTKDLDNLSDEYPTGHIIYNKSTNTLYFNTKESGLSYYDEGGTGYFREIATADQFVTKESLDETLESYIKRGEMPDDNVTGEVLEAYKEYVDKTYAKLDDLVELTNDYLPSDDLQNRFVADDTLEGMMGKTWNDLNKNYSYSELFDKVLFKKFAPTITDPTVTVDIKPEWNGSYIKLNDNTLLVEHNSTGPDGVDFYAKDYTDAVINYPEGLSIDNLFTKGIMTTDQGYQNNKGFCKVKDVNGDWVYYMKDGETKHVPSTLTEGEYRYHLAAYFAPGAPALDNDSNIIDKWDESTAVESDNYITIIASKPIYVNSTQGMVKQDLPVYTPNGYTAEIYLNPSCQCVQSFQIPYELKNAYIWNDAFGGYAQIPSISAASYIPAYFNKIYSNGLYTYSYDNDKYGHRGAIKMKIEY